MAEQSGPEASCCDGDGERSCVFAKALFARAASCELAHRRLAAEHEVLECASPPARIDCAALAALLHERARFALRLPPVSRPLTHMQSLRLQCGGLAALRQEFAESAPDVHRTVDSALERHGSLAELPWTALVAAIAAWQPRRRRLAGS